MVRVDRWTDLDQMIFWAGWKSGQYGGDVVLKILAHGIESVTDYVGPLINLQPVSSQGGGGIQVCREGIRLSTIHKFGKIWGKLRMIQLLGCAAAYITPGFEGHEGDGNLLCYRLAQIAQTYVRASTADQKYTFGGIPNQPIDFGPWEGTVVTYGPWGGNAKLPWE